MDSEAVKNQLRLYILCCILAGGSYFFFETFQKSIVNPFSLGAEKREPEKVSINLTFTVTTGSVNEHMIMTGEVILVKLYCGGMVLLYFIKFIFEP